jgi:hypothetical protein
MDDLEIRVSVNIDGRQWLPLIARKNTEGAVSIWYDDTTMLRDGYRTYDEAIDGAEHWLRDHPAPAVI